jgi:hypothetical protein
MGTKVLSNQRVTVMVGLASSISDFSSPETAELAAMTNVSGAINWNSFDINVQASDQQDDRTLTDGAGAQSRGFTNFGGSLELVTPTPSDAASIYRVAYTLMSTPRVELVVAIRYGKLSSLPPVASDEWNIFRVMTDAVAFGQSEVSKYYTVALIPRDDVLVSYILPAATPTAVSVAVLDASIAVGDLVFASALYQGRRITKSATWTSSDEALLTVVHPGIFRALAIGSPTISATYPGGTASTAAAITITAV